MGGTAKGLEGKVAGKGTEGRGAGEEGEEQEGKV
jgi:hypothetical protein